MKDYTQTRLKKKICQKKNELIMKKSIILEQLPLMRTIKEYFEKKCQAVRQRTLTPWQTLKIFITQHLDFDGSCRQAIKKTVLGEELNLSENTAGYCKARQRLDISALKETLQYSGAVLQKEASKKFNFHGRSVKMVDGSTISMPDTPANQEAFPQPESQEPGIGFPLARIVAVLCLVSGALLDIAIAPYQGKLTGEHALLREILSVFTQGDIVIGDRYYGSYWLLCLLKEIGVDVLFEQHASRKSDFRRGKRLSKGDHILAWTKPCKPDWLTQEKYDALPDTLEVREIKSGKKTLITTLLDSKIFSKVELRELYFLRWDVEIDLRSIKTIMGMEVLRCKTPEMIKKELWVGLLTYNIIRSMMTMTAVFCNLHPRQISFKGCMQTINAISFQIKDLSEDFLNKILTSISNSLVRNRPGRQEPRAVKRRPKPYPRLTKPRSQYCFGA